MSKQKPHSDVRIRTYLLPNGGMRITLRGMRSGQIHESTMTTRNGLVAMFLIMRMWVRGAKDLAPMPDKPDGAVADTGPDHVTPLIEQQ